jgi:hypothetical protein
MRIMAQDRRECPMRCVGNGKRCKCMCVVRLIGGSSTNRDRSVLTAACDMGPIEKAAGAPPLFFLLAA